MGRWGTHADGVHLSGGYLLTGEKGPAFGRVDELDDPRPGHLSDCPTPISSTTTITTTLQDRFVKGEDQEQQEIQGKTEVLEENKVEAGTKVEETEKKDKGEKMDENKAEAGDRKTGKDKASESEGGEDKENQG